MSFADELKRELAEIPVKHPCCRRALLTGLLLNAVTNGKTVSVRLGNGFVTDCADEWIRLQFGKAPEREEHGGCGKRYFDLALSSPAAVRILRQRDQKDAEPQTVAGFSCEGCRSAFLRGALLATATVNDPRKSFHLEFLMTNAHGEELLSRFLEETGYPPGRIMRPTGTGLYFKGSGSVEELITLTGAHHIIFDVINSRIERDIRNNENRATNCVARNIQKAVSASAKQVGAIERLTQSGKLERLPEPLRETAKIRSENPDATLDELATLHDPPITKSGLNHRLQKLIEAAEGL